MPEELRNKLIVALDVETVTQARDLVSQLRNDAGMFKIGSQLFTAAGPEFVREVVAAGSRIFLDLKFHDIPNTVAAAAVEAVRLGVSILNVHASGGGEMMRRAADAVSEIALRDGIERPSIIGVTVLTSSDAATLRGIGVANAPQDQVIKLALLAAESGMDGVVASPLEVSVIRSAVTSPGFLIVTPGVRPAGSLKDDQKRIMTPADALRAGADYLVVGRPIIAAADPGKAAREILSEMRSAAATTAVPAEEGTAGH